MRPTVHTSALPYRAYRETDFKQTDIGPIPHDWEVVTLGSLSTKIGSGKTPRGGEAVYLRSGHPFVRSQNVGYGSIDLDDIAYIPDELHLLQKSTEIQTNDVLLNITGASIGRCSLACHEVVGGNVNQHVCIIRVDSESLVPKYLVYSLLSNVGQNQIKNLQSGASREALNFSKVADITIPFPPLPEQKRIAEVLDHLDEHIGNLTTLLQKRKLVKEAAMRELLSGSRRLPGYTGPWKKYTLGEIVSVERGELLRSSDFKNGTIPVVAGGMGIAGFHNRCNRGGKTITIGASGAAGFVNFYSSPIFASDCCTISENENYDIKFLYYDLKSMQADIYRLQSGGVQKHIYPKDLKSLSVVLPPSLEEQAAIATVLSHMDDDIEVLEQKIEKYRQLKEGVMQELLTGNTRLL